MLDTKEEIKEIRSKRGKKSRASGRKFELDVRHDLESRGWIVCKWTNTVDLENNCLIQAKSKYNPFLHRIISEGAGWPDFVGFKQKEEGDYKVIGVESKKAKYLDAKEKAMAIWLLNNKIFKKIYIAHPIKEGRKKVIVYQQFER